MHPLNYYTILYYTILYDTIRYYIRYEFEVSTVVTLPHWSKKLRCCSWNTILFVRLNIVRGCQNAQNEGKRPLTADFHAPYFSLKNAKLRPNIIIIDTLRAARVFIAFIFPQPCECALFQISVARESFLPYKSSARVLLEKWRSKGAMNFRENDADRSNDVFSMFSNAFYAPYKEIEAAYRCSLIIIYGGKNGGLVHPTSQFCSRLCAP